MMATYGFGLGGGGGDTTIIVSAVVNANLASTLQADIGAQSLTAAIQQPLSGNISNTVLTANAEELTGNIRCLIE